MSIKRKKYWKKAKPLTYLLTRTEKSLLVLQRKAGDFKDPEHNRIAFDLIRQYSMKGKFSYAQLDLMKELNLRPSRKKISQDAYLYAIAAGNGIKIGLSSDPERRLKELQTGNPLEAELLWRLGPVPRKEAHKLEKQIHRKCKKFHTKGEWFTQACMDTVFRFESSRPAINYTEM